MDDGTETPEKVIIRQVLPRYLCVVFTEQYDTDVVYCRSRNAHDRNKLDRMGKKDVTLEQMLETLSFHGHL